MKPFQSGSQGVTLNMQHQDRGLEAGRAAQDELSLHLTRFALVLSGDVQIARRLVDKLTGAGLEVPDKNMSPSAYQFYQLKNLYELWNLEAGKPRETPALFRPGHEIEAIQCGLDPSIARVMGRLPSLHRALLLLIYGEKFSYAATGQLLGISTEELMTALAGAHRSFSREGGGQAVSNKSEALYDAAR